MSIRLNENFNNSIPFLQGYKYLKIPIMDNAGNPAWPEMFPVDKIHELETIVGPRHFSAQMMLEYVAEERVRLDPGAVHFYDQEFEWQYVRIGQNHITGFSCYWDPSSGHRNSDGSVCVLVYKDDKNKTAFVHDVLYMEVSDDDIHPLSTQCQNVINFMQKHKLNRIGIEINGIGNALPEILRQVAQENQVHLSILPIANHTKKETRILNALEPLLATGRLYMHDRIRQTMLLSEMLAWTPIGSCEHDDGLDAISGALSMMPCPVHPSNTYKQINKANTDFTI
jgi:predicted phage terminase large subunit-like protein